MAAVAKKSVKRLTSVSRRLGLQTDIWNGEKLRRKYYPGQHGPSGMRRFSTFAQQLKEKQRVKVFYGLLEKQLSALFRSADQSRGDTGISFVRSLESRLDAFVLRSRFAPTIYCARQLVRHKHVLVNGKNVNIPSYQLKIGDVITIKDSAKEIPALTNTIANNDVEIPVYIELDKEKLVSKFVSLPEIKDVPFPFKININAIIEYYSR